MAQALRGPGAATTFLALLRGVNVGGKNRVAMKELAGLLAGAGLEEVRTYIQSGNAIFRAPRAKGPELPGLIAGLIAERFDLSVPVVIRSAEELSGVVRSNPFLEGGADPEALYVAFLADEPAAARIAALDPNRSPPDAFRVRGREVYLHLPNGVAGSRLTNDYFDSRLGTRSTARNWRTVLKLAELCGASGSATYS
jgi:uncharacterized protein (DUF1697 family)